MGRADQRPGPGGRRHSAAIGRATDQRADLARLRVPKLVTYPGMGHDLPTPLWPTIIDEISALAASNNS